VVYWSQFVLTQPIQDFATANLQSVGRMTTNLGQRYSLHLIHSGAALSRVLIGWSSTHILQRGNRIEHLRTLKVEDIHVQEVRHRLASAFDFKPTP
jgi:hypothetical protein